MEASSKQRVRRKSKRKRKRTRCPKNRKWFKENPMRAEESIASDQEDHVQANEVEGDASKYLLVSISMTGWVDYYKSFAEVRQREGPGVYRNSSLPADMQEAMGALSIIDWKNKTILGALPLPLPQGFLLEEGGRKMMVALRRTNNIFCIEEDRIDPISHPLLANIHTIDILPSILQDCPEEMRRSRDGEDTLYLVTSSDSDIIAEINKSGEIVWSWWATENGYDKLPNGTPHQTDEEKDYRDYTSIAREHTTHVNSAIYQDSQFILATFFHQGILLRIEKDTGESQVVLDGLKHPHSIRRRARGGFILCDSFNRRIILLDEDLNTEKIIAIGSEDHQDLGGDRGIQSTNDTCTLGWVQDAFEVWVGNSEEGNENEQRIFCLSNIDVKSWLEEEEGSDSQEGGDNKTLVKENRIIEIRWDEDQRRYVVVDSMPFGQQNHLYAVQQISTEVALRWQEQWSTHLIREMLPSSP